jgi:hypothetical protein
LEYRDGSPEENGYESEEEEDAHLTGFIRHTMTSSGPNDLLDSLLMITNVCEMRALLAGSGSLAGWYRDTGTVLRQMLDVLCNSKATYKPLAKLENSEFYFPDTNGIAH